MRQRMTIHTGAGRGTRRGKAGSGWVLLCSYGLYPEQITMETFSGLRGCDAIISDRHPRLMRWLPPHASMLPLPGSGTRPSSLARTARLAARLAASGCRVGVVIYGNPSFMCTLQETLAIECARRGVALRPLNAISSFDAAWSLLSLNDLPNRGLRLLSACTAPKRFLDPDAANMLFNLNGIWRPKNRLPALLRELKTRYPASHPAALIRCRCPSVRSDEVRRMSVGELIVLLCAADPETMRLDTLYVPPLEEPALTQTRAPRCVP